MRQLSTHDLLTVWEVGDLEHPVARALTLLRAACPEVPLGELAALTMGQRDALLYSLREQTFGPALRGQTVCPRCAERTEFTTTTRALRANSPQKELPAELRCGEYRVRFRLPSSRDLLALSAIRNPRVIRERLLARCVLQASVGEQPLDARELPEAVIAELAEAMAECDPQGGFLIGIECPTCQNRFGVALDILGFLWTELATLVQRLFREVHTLAKAYGWSQPEILALSARQRQVYLEMVGT